MQRCSTINERQRAAFLYRFSAQVRPSIDVPRVTAHRHRPRSGRSHIVEGRIRVHLLDRIVTYDLQTLHLAPGHFALETALDEEPSGQPLNCFGAGNFAAFPHWTGLGLSIESPVPDKRCDLLVLRSWLGCLRCLRQNENRAYHYQCRYHHGSFHPVSPLRKESCSWSAV
jgi:hypothetical protein